MGLSVSIFGLGYVGSVSAACFASMGHKVIGVDVSRAKVEMLGLGAHADHRGAHERDGRRGPQVRPPVVPRPMRPRRC